MMSVMEQQVTNPPMSLADRCDRCGAQAKARHYFQTGELLMCAHHDREFADAMLETEVSARPVQVP